MNENTDHSVTLASKLAQAKKIRQWLHHGQSFELFKSFIPVQMCDQALAQIIDNEGQGVIHPSVILDVATLKTFPSEAHTLALYCLNGGLVELTQHGGKGSDVRKAVADVAHKKTGVEQVQAWLEAEKPKHPLFLQQMPVLMCQRALDEIAENSNKGLMHPSIILSLGKHKPFHAECQELALHCLHKNLVQVTRTEQASHLSKS